MAINWRRTTLFWTHKTLGAAASLYVTAKELRGCQFAAGLMCMYIYIKLYIIYIIYYTLSYDINIMIYIHIYVYIYICVFSGENEDKP